MLMSPVLIWDCLYNFFKYILPEFNTIKLLMKTDMKKRLYSTTSVVGIIVYIPRFSFHHNSLFCFLWCWSTSDIELELQPLRIHILVRKYWSAVRISSHFNGPCELFGSDFITSYSRSFRKKCYNFSCKALRSYNQQVRIVFHWNS